MLPHQFQRTCPSLQGLFATCILYVLSNLLQPIYLPYTPESLCYVYALSLVLVYFPGTLQLLIHTHSLHALPFCASLASLTLWSSNFFFLSCFRILERLTFVYSYNSASLFNTHLVVSPLLQSLSPPLRCLVRSSLPLSFPLSFPPGLLFLSRANIGSRHVERFELQRSILVAMPALPQLVPLPTQRTMHVLINSIGTLRMHTKHVHNVPRIHAYINT